MGTGKWSQGDPFNNLQFFFYWTSTTDAQNTDFAWFVGMKGGHVHNTMRSDTFTSGQSETHYRLHVVDNGNERGNAGVLATAPAFLCADYNLDFLETMID